MDGKRAFRFSVLVCQCVNGSHRKTLQYNINIISFSFSTSSYSNTFISTFYNEIPPQGKWLIELWDFINSL